MKQALTILVFITTVLFGCKEKEKDKQQPGQPPDIAIKDTIKHLPDVMLENPEKDMEVSMMKRKKPVPPPPPKDQPPVDTAQKTFCIFLDYDGHTTANTMWNVNGPFYTPPSFLTEAQQQANVDSLRSYFKFNPGIHITRDSTVFFSFSSFKRIRVVIGPNTWYSGNVGGISYINSASWGSNEPCYVFDVPLGNIKFIGDACAHEPGHTLGLRHQSDWRDGVFYGDYLWGPLIMGASYYDPGPRFGIGINSLGITQNDTLIINTTVRK